jgi:RNA polymerase sigma factor (sigma-70 family)
MPSNWFATMFRNFLSGRRLRRMIRPPRPRLLRRLEALDERSLLSAATIELGWPGLANPADLLGATQAVWTSQPEPGGHDRVSVTSASMSGLARLLDDLGFDQWRITFSAGQSAGSTALDMAAAAQGGVSPPSSPPPAQDQSDPTGMATARVPAGPDAMGNQTTPAAPKPDHDPAAPTAPGTPRPTGASPGTPPLASPAGPPEASGASRASDASVLSPPAAARVAGSPTDSWSGAGATQADRPVFVDVGGSPRTGRDSNAAADWNRPMPAAGGTTDRAASGPTAEARPGLGGVSDGVLLQRFAATREQAAFTELVRRHEPSVLAAATRVLGDPDLARDASQATFLALARRAGWLDAGGPLGGWLYRVACRAALRLRTAAARRWRLEQAAGDNNPRDELDPLAPVEDADVWRVLQEELGRLPEKYRQPLELCYLEGRTHAEVARAVGLPRGSVAKRIGEGLERLRDRLAGRGFVF